MKCVEMVVAQDGHQVKIVVDNGQELLVQITGEDHRDEDPARLVELSYDMDVVLAKIAKGGKTNERCAEIIRLRYLSEKVFTQRDVAKKMKISTCRVGQLEARALVRLRKFGVRMGLIEVTPHMIPSRPQL